METIIFGEKWLIHDVGGGLAHCVSRLAQSLRASNIEKRKLLLNLDEKNGLISQAIANGSIGFGELQTRRPKIGKIALLDETRINPGPIVIRYDTKASGSYVLDKPLFSRDISIEKIQGRKEKIIITRGESTSGIDCKQEVAYILGHIEFKSRLFEKFKTPKKFNAVHFRNTDRKSDLEATIRYVNENFEIDSPIYRATDDYLSFREAEKLLPMYQFFRSSVPVQKPDGFRNIHELPPRILIDNNLSNGDIWESLFEDIFHLLHADKLHISSSATGWGTLIPHLRIQQSKRESLFIKDGIDRWSKDS